MNIKHRFTLLVGAFVLGFVVFGVVVFDTLNALKVNGPYYQKIVQGKDLVADILPPPEYILESYLVAHQMADPANRTFLPGLTRKSETLRQEFDDRHKFWVDNLPASTEGEKQIKQAMVDESYPPALRFLNTFHDKFLPAVQRGDYPEAQQLLHGPLQKDYEEHRTAINQVVALTNTSNQIIEADAARVIIARLTVLGALGVAIVAGTAFGIRRFIKQALAEERAKINTAPASSPIAAPGTASRGAEPDLSSSSLARIIQDLAHQTNTLALNAALEAARTGEQSRKFGEAAVEIRRMADANTQLGERIHDLVEYLQTPTTDAPGKQTP